MNRLAVNFGMEPKETDELIMSGVCDYLNHNLGIESVIENGVLFVDRDSIFFQNQDDRSILAFLGQVVLKRAADEGYQLHI